MQPVADEYEREWFWKEEVLLKRGLDRQDVFQLLATGASRTEIEGLLDKGCPAKLAVRILHPLEETRK